MEALSQTNKRSFKPKHITWCSLSVMFIGILQVFGVARVGKEVHAEHSSGAGELQAPQDEGSQVQTVTHSSFKEQLLSQGNPIQSGVCS